VRGSVPARTDNVVTSRSRWTSLPTPGAVVALPDAVLDSRENGQTDLRRNIGSGGQTIGRIAFTVTGEDLWCRRACVRPSRARRR
jgi:hypothetical protein